MEFQFALNARALEGARAHVSRRLRNRGGLGLFWRAMAAGLLLGLVLQWNLNPLMHGVSASIELVGVAVLGWVVMRMRAVHHALELLRQAGGYMLVPDAEGIEYRTPSNEVTRHPWPEVAALESGADGLYFYLRDGGVLAVPGTAPGADALAMAVRAHWSAHPAHAGRTLPTIPPPAVTPMRQCAVALGQAVRLALFRGTDLESVQATPGVLLLLLLIQSIILIAQQYLQALPLPILNPAGIGTSLLTIVLAAAWAAAACAMLSRAEILLRAMVLATAAVVVVNGALLAAVLAIAFTFQIVVDLATVWKVLAAIWLLAVLARVSLHLFGLTRAGSVFLSAAYLLASLTLAAVTPQSGLYINAAMIGAFHFRLAPDAPPDRMAPPAPEGKAPGGEEGASPP